MRKGCLGWNLWNPWSHLWWWSEQPCRRTLGRLRACSGGLRRTLRSSRSTLRTLARTAACARRHRCRTRACPPSSWIWMEKNWKREALILRWRDDCKDVGEKISSKSLTYTPSARQKAPGRRNQTAAPGRILGARWSQAFSPPSHGWCSWSPWGGHKTAGCEGSRLRCCGSPGLAETGEETFLSFCKIDSTNRTLHLSFQHQLTHFGVIQAAYGGVGVHVGPH